MSNSYVELTLVNVTKSSTSIGVRWGEASGVIRETPDSENGARIKFSLYIK